MSHDFASLYSFKQQGYEPYVTINILRGIPLHEIMRASGHTSYSDFQKYWCYYD